MSQALLARPVGWGRELDFHVSEMFVEQAMIMEGDCHNSGDSVAELEERRVFPLHHSCGTHQPSM